LDEVLALPSERAAAIALRTQQVLMEETGITNVADPLGGSWYVESLTDAIEAEAEELFARIKGLGDGTTMTSGLLRGIDDGWFTGHIADAAFREHEALQTGEQKIVGVNAYIDESEPSLEILRVSHEVEHEQREALAKRRAGRDQAAVDAALARVREVARGDGNLIEPLLDAARVEATLGEMCQLLVGEWGAYTEPPWI
jgi:methylmalonyl-CoA mutase N-terminal domain/subunit